MKKLIFISIFTLLTCLSFSQRITEDIILDGRSLNDKLQEQSDSINQTIIKVNQNVIDILNAQLKANQAYDTARAASTKAIDAGQASQRAVDSTISHYNKIVILNDSINKLRLEIEAIASGGGSPTPSENYFTDTVYAKDYTFTSFTQGSFEYPKHQMMPVIADTGVGFLEQESYFGFENYDFGDGCNRVDIYHVAHPDYLGSFNIILDNPTNSPVTGFTNQSTGGWSSEGVMTVDLGQTISGIHDVYLKSLNNSNGIIYWMYFYQSSDVTPPTLISAAVSDDKRNIIRASFSEKVNASIFGWNVTADSGSVSILSVTNNQTISPAFNLSRSMKYGENIYLSYVKTAGSTTDLSENEVDNINGYVVSNNIQPTVINSSDYFFENFEDNTIGTYDGTEFTNDWNPVWSDPDRGQIVTSSNNKRLQTDFPLGSYGWVGGAGGAATSAALYQWATMIDTAAQQLTFEYDVYFEPGFGTYDYAGKLPGLSANGTPGGGYYPTTDASFRYMFHGNQNGTVRIQLYMYYPGMYNTSYYNDPEPVEGKTYYGQGPTVATVPVGQWINLKQVVNLGTPSSTYEGGNGWVEVYVNGQLRVKQENLWLRKTSSVNLDRVWFSTFFGGSGIESQADTYIQFDNFKVYKDVFVDDPPSGGGGGVDTVIVDNELKYNDINVRANTPTEYSSSLSDSVFYISAYKGYAGFTNIDFNQIDTLTVTYSCTEHYTETIRITLDGWDFWNNTSIPQVKIWSVPPTATWDTYRTEKIVLDQTIDGVHDLYFVSAGSYIKIHKIVYKGTAVQEAPSLTNANVTQSYTSAEFSVNSNEGGTLYYANVLNGVSVSSYNSVAMSNSANTVNITGLSENTAYDLWYFAKDAGNNYTDTVKIDYTTLLSASAPTDPTGTGDYYFSNTGNDGNTGTSPSQAWKSTARLINTIKNAQPGDSILLERGSTWYDVKVHLDNVDGTASENIYIGSYGLVGDKPVISGGIQVTGFSQSGNIWTKTGLAWREKGYIWNPATVVINDQYNSISQYPDMGTYYYTESSGFSELYDNTQSWTTNEYAGEQVIYKDVRWDYGIIKVTGNNSNTLYLGDWYTVDENNNYGGMQGRGYYWFRNVDKGLNNQGEWTYHNGTLKVYYTGDLNAQSVEFPNQDTLLYMKNCDYWEFKDIELRSANGMLIHLNGGTNFTIDDCRLQFAGSLIEMIGVNGMDLTNSDLNYSHSAGITGGRNMSRGLGSGNVNIYDNRFSNIAPEEGVKTKPDNYYAGGAAIIMSYNTGPWEIKYNRFDTVIAAVMAHYNQGNWNVERNVFYKYGWRITDLGGVYVSHDKDGSVSKIIRKNIFLEPGGFAGNAPGQWHGGADEGVHAIYTDAEGDYVRADSNLIYKTGIGIMQNTSRHDIFADNTLVQAATTNMVNDDWSSQVHMGNTILNDYYGNNEYNTYLRNYFVMGNRTSEVAFGFHGNDAYPFRYNTQTIDHNIVYDPFTPGNNYTHKNQPYTYLTMATACSWYGYDCNGVWQPINHTYADVSEQITADEFIRVVYNDTKQNKTIFLQDTYIDKDGTTYVGNITLEPFTWKVLFYYGP